MKVKGRVLHIWASWCVGDLHHLHWKLDNILSPYSMWECLIIMLGGCHGSLAVVVTGL